MIDLSHLREVLRLEEKSFSERVREGRERESEGEWEGQWGEGERVGRGTCEEFMKHNRVEYSHVTYHSSVFPNPKVNTPNTRITIQICLQKRKRRGGGGEE